MRPPRLRTTGPISRWWSAMRWAATSSPSLAVKRVNPSRSVNITVTGCDGCVVLGVGPPSDRPCSALRPTEASVDGRRSEVRSRNRCTISTGGAVRNGFSAGCSSHARSTRPTSAAWAAHSGSLRIRSARRSDTVRRKRGHAPARPPPSPGPLAPSGHRRWGLPRAVPRPVPPSPNTRAGRTPRGDRGAGKVA